MQKSSDLLWLFKYFSTVKLCISVQGCSSGIMYLRKRLMSYGSRRMPTLALSSVEGLKKSFFSAEHGGENPLIRSPLHLLEIFLHTEADS